MTNPNNEGGHTLADIHRLIPATRNIPADKMPLHDFIGADGQERWTQASVVEIEKLHDVLHSFTPQDEPGDGPLARVIKKRPPE